MMINLRTFMKTSDLFLQFPKVKVFLNGINQCFYFKDRQQNVSVVSLKKSVFLRQNRNLSTEYEDLAQTNDDLDLFGFLEDNDLKRKSTYFRNLLYPESDDVIINKLKNCVKFVEVFEIIDNCDSVTFQQLSQAVLTLRDLKKSFELYNEFNLNKNETTSMNDFTSCQSFEKLLNLIEKNSSLMNLEELSANLLYLMKFNVKNDRLLTIIDAFERKLKNTHRDDISLSCLARFCIPIKVFSNIWSYYTLINILPIVCQHLDECTDYANFRHITTCFQKMAPLLNSDIIFKYTEKCQFLLKKNENDQELERIRTIIKCVVFLSFKIWNREHKNLVKQLLLSTHGSLNYLSIEEIVLMCRLVLNLKEPVQLIHEIHQIVSNWISHYRKLDDHTSLLILHLMFPKMGTFKTKELPYFEKFFKRPINHNELFWSLNSIYYSLLCSTLKMNRKLNAAYWERILETLNLYNLKDSSQLIWISLRYINFIQVNTNRQTKFEQSMLLWLTQCIFEDKIHNPSTYTKLALLILYFEELPLKIFTDQIYEKVLNFIHNLTVCDNAIASFLLSATFQIKDTNTKFLRYYVILISALNTNSLENLKTNNQLNIADMNNILASYCQRQGLKTTELFRMICNGFKTISADQLCSKSILNTITSCNKSDHLFPEIVNQMVEYTANEKENMHVFTATCILNHMFKFGFIPKQIEQFIETVITTMEKQRKHVHRLNLLKSALSLNYFSEIPVELTDHIFNIDFLRETEMELENSYSINNYPRKVRSMFMELNRAVCIDYPYRNIPWFHDLYCKKLAVKLSYKSHPFYVDVLQTLKELVKVEKSIQIACHSPYGHRIDILLYLNKHGIPVNPEHYNSEDLKKIAVLLKNTKSHSNYYRGKGMRELHIRQLQQLNYKVVEINSYLWNSMCMSEPFAKKNYFETQIWGKEK